MTRMSVLLALALLVCVPLACTFLTEVRISAPPKGSGAEADRWWQETVDGLPLNFLAVYAETSAVHLKKGTAATYVDWYQSPTTADFCQYELRLPSPPPEAASTRIKERLQSFKPAKEADASDRRQDHVIAAEDMQGCSYHQAMDVWHAAEKKLTPWKVKVPPTTTPKKG